MARTLYIALILSTVFAANGILANDDMCRPEPGMPVCNGRGDCIEGECICWQGNSPEEVCERDLLVLEQLRGYNSFDRRRRQWLIA